MAEEDFITLEFDDGTSEETEIIGIFDFNNKEYIALEPTDKRGDAYIFEYKENDEDFELLDIESEKEFEEAAKEFDRIMSK